MKKYLFPVLLMMPLFSLAQVLLEGRVLDSRTKEPLPFVNILEPGTRKGTSTDIDGRFNWPLRGKHTTLTFSFIGYDKKTIDIHPEDTDLVIHLVEKAAELEEIVVVPGINPAHRIIRNAVRMKSLNQPESLPSFQYKTYSKFIATVRTDSLKQDVDTILHNSLDTSYTEYDSSSYHLKKFVEKQHLFMMETVTERKFLPPGRDNETVLASRTSGFKNPLFSLFITQLQSFSFYDDYIRIGGDEYLNPITKGSTSRYFFIIEDTTFNSSRDTVFVISFRPRPNYGFKPMKGILNINTSSWAVQSVIAEPAESEGVSIRIEQRYKLYGERTWFPDQLNAEVVFSSVKVNDVTPEARMRTYLKNVQIGDELKRKDIARAQITIDDLAVENADKILARYRNDTLSEKEANTYVFMDSIGEEFHLDRKVNILASIYSGRLPVKFVDIDLDKILKYNEYEGFRLGMGAHTNARFSRWFTTGGYFGYGFKDQVTKYGWDAHAMLNRNLNLALFGGYQFDLFESGGTHFLLTPKPGLLTNNYRQLFIPVWDENSRYFAGISYDPLISTRIKLMLQRENRYTVGHDYFFVPDAEDPSLLENGFNYFEAIASLRYAPNEKIAESGQTGKILLEAAYPVVYFEYTRGMSNIWESEFDYDKIDLKIVHHKKWIRIGETALELQGGTVLQNIPYSKLYTGKANLSNKDDFWERNLMIADRNSFETMRFNEFLSDTYIHLMFRQDFRTLLLRRKEFAPHVEVVARALWGGLRDPSRHRDLAFKIPDKGYYEAGIELNRLMGTIGLAFYYRIGPYSFDNFTDNFSLKLSSKFAF